MFNANCRAALHALQDRPLAILPAALNEFRGVLHWPERQRGVEARADGNPPSGRPGPLYGRSRLTAGDTRGMAQSRGGVAVLSLFGPLTQRADIFSEFFGWTSLEAFGVAFDRVVKDKSITGILLVIDSPGGSVFGVQELADRIYTARAQKPIVAIADAMAASAAYWLGTQATELLIAPSGQVGSIGCLTVHEDLSGMMAQIGVATTLVSAGRYKTEGNPYEPLTADAGQAIQDMVNQYYDQFVAAVARGRGVSAATVRNGFGQGRMLTARAAVDARMADRISTLDAALGGLQTQRYDGKLTSMDLINRRLQLDSLD